MKGNIAVIRIRSASRATKQVIDTMDMLRLRNKNVCTVHPKKESVMGMIRKIENFVTYGEVTDETIKLLEEKRGGYKNKKGEPIKYYRLHPPRKGFERKGIKKGFSVGGALGYRAEKINDLIKRMI